MIRYHDREWGVPVHRDRKMFEFLVLESAQAGLSWRIVLHKRAGYKQAFANFDPQKVAKFTGRDVERLVRNPAIIRNRLKIKATINNAQRFLEVQKEFGSFNHYIWNFVQHKPIRNRWTKSKHIPAVTPLAEKVAADMKDRGFKFLGPTVMYAHLQATGVVNDHLTNCWRY
jgi:DNA-3-methyladenine glycosylase I